VSYFDILKELRKSLNNIPDELKALNQWVLWKNEDIGASKPTKVPYSIRHMLASVSDPDTWSSFDNVLNNLSNGYSGIGFVFTDSDPYTFIDLDDTEGDNVALDRQLKIYKEFDSWSEISPSGKGLHIIIKGSIPQGRRRSYIEIYSSSRYAAFTGQVYNNKPIVDRQHILTQLYEQMGSGGIATNVYRGSNKEKQTDEQIIEQASNAANGDKFKNLYSGKWQSLYPSQSEADFAFIDIVAFYTQNRNQIIRIFHKSSLGTRDKAKRKDYLIWMINKSFDRMLPPIDFDGFKIALEDKLKNQEKKVLKQHSTIHSRLNDVPLQIPPGLLGEIAQFIYAAAPRPVPEIALAAAIGLMAGVCGRAYNISGTGLNQYVLLLAQTGCHTRGTKILMYDGSTKNVEDIQINELIMGYDSSSRQVLNLARGKEQMVKIIPTKGQEFIVNINHILSLVDTITRKRTNIRVCDWINKNHEFKHRNKLERKAVNFTQSNHLPIDPWFLGAMIGDGQFGPRIALTSQDESIRNKAKNIIKFHFDMKVVTTQVSGNKSFQDNYIKNPYSAVYYGRQSQLQIAIQNLNLWLKKAENKFIPLIYKTASRFDRMAILAGLLDTDGNLTNGNTYDYISKSKQLAEDVVFIARSLGYAAYVKSCEKLSQNGTGGTYYRVSISGNTSELPLVLEYKKSKARQQKKDVLVTGFKIELLSDSEYFGFTLDGDHLYLTADFTVHHNTGKEAMASGIDRLMNTIRLQVPTSIGFIGPSEIASGQALIKHLNKVSQCFVSILGEFGLRLEALANPHSNSAEKALKRMLLDLYHKSGFGQSFRPTIYADRDKNIDVTVSPSFTILAESTPSTFYGALNEDMIADGLLPRFLIVEYEGARPALSHTHLEAQPSFSLIEKFASLAANCEMIMYNKRVINIASSKDAEELLKKFDKFADDQINATQKEVLRQLWNRAHMKVLKLSALIAIGVNMSDPIVLPEYVQWSINMVQNDIRALSGKFDRGEIGKSSSESKQTEEVIRVIRDYFNIGWERASSYGVERNIYESKIIPYAYLSRRLIASSAFRLDRLGSTMALKRTLQNMIDGDVIREINKVELSAKHGTTQRAFFLRKMELLS